MKKAIARVLPMAVVVLLVAGCGGDSHHSGPTTFAHLADWLEEEGECEGVDAEVTHLPVPGSRAEKVASINLRFEQASVAAVAICGGLSGHISYYRFPSAEAREAAVRGREGLISNELFCVRGPELVVNGLLGFDQTVPFCKRLGFEIHQPTRKYSFKQNLEHHLEFRAADLVGRVVGEPPADLDCRHTDRPREFECEEFVSGKVIDVELVRKDGRYVIKGCEDLGIHRTKDGFRGESCAFPAHHR